MNTTAKWCIALICVAALSGFAGIAVGIYAERSRPEMLRRTPEDWMNGMALSHSALDTVNFTTLLKGYRDGKQEATSERLESLLDFALINTAREYTPERDDYRTAAKALRMAAEYRAEHPHRNSIESVAIQVDAALQLSTTVPRQP